MIPIGVASIVTMAFTMERLVGLRRGRNLPKELIRKLRELMSDSGMDPRRLWEACDEHKSPLANVVKAAVLKTGRPHAELEKSVEDAVGRETAAMTRNMRPINVVASIAPLLGLLGTVQGMIMAFMVTSTTSSTGTAKAQELAHGIYTALVTTFCRPERRRFFSRAGELSGGPHRTTPASNGRNLPGSPATAGTLRRSPSYRRIHIHR